jgi:acetolactate synthase I/II/III large subunit
MASSKKTKGSVGRRGFLRGAAAGAAALVAKPPEAIAQPRPQGAVGNASAATPTQAALNVDVGNGRPIPGINGIELSPGSDYMVDVLKQLDFEYVVANPGTSFAGLHESLLNYGNNTKPEFLTACHEESAVSMAHGYAKIEGKPMLVLLHADVGIQHASMAIFNAYADRVPIYMIAGNWGHAVQAHNAQDMALMIRDMIKWDDEPRSLPGFADAAQKAYAIAMMPPMGPTLLVVDEDLQEMTNQEPNLRVPKFRPIHPASGDLGSVREAAKLLVNAENPVIITGRSARTASGMALLVELAELLQAPVSGGDRMNFPLTHPLSGAGIPGAQPDVTLALEVNNAPVGRNGGKTINISSTILSLKNNYQDVGDRFTASDIDMAADAEATLPALIEECRKLVTGDRKRVFEERGKKLGEAHREARVKDIELAAIGWDASPVSLNRLYGELWPFIKNEDWSMVSWDGFMGGWPRRLWAFDKHYHYIGAQGAGGMGYGAGAAVGAALANKKHGRISINVQTDGDLNYQPAVLWTAAHHKAPLLTIMHNNRAYHQEVMRMQRQATAMNRGVDKIHIGTKLWNPEIDYASIAKGYGMYAEGPISDPKDLAAAYKRGIERVKNGEPALIDVVTQPRG